MWIALVGLGVKELNRRTVTVPLRSAQNLLGLPSGATHVDLTVRDVWAAQAIGEQLRRELLHQFETGGKAARSWSRRSTRNRSAPV